MTKNLKTISIIILLSVITAGLIIPVFIAKYGWNWKRWIDGFLKDIGEDELPYHL